MPPGWPPWFGSPASFVAPSTVPCTLPPSPEIGFAAANASFELFSTVHAQNAGVGSVPPASLARTRNVCALSARAL